jgi:type IV pilus assembly protein PilY1
MSCQTSGSTKYCAYTKWTLKNTGVDGASTSVAPELVYDWFERLYLRPTDATQPPYLLDSASAYSDAGKGYLNVYNSIPNLLEKLVNDAGGWIFLLTDDDTDTSTIWKGTVMIAPKADVQALNDSIPDYDVNGDGVIDALDRVVDLGTFDAGTELVFFIVVYYDQTVEGETVNWPQSFRYDTSSTCSSGSQCASGICEKPSGDNKKRCKLVIGADLVTAPVLPFFSKTVLNPDYATDPIADSSTNIDIGCEDGSTCGGYKGWLNSATHTRLSNLYGVTLPHEVKTVVNRTGGQFNHMLLGAPSTSPTLWLLGFEDLYGGGDMDYNDVTFLIWRTNGGEAVSNLVVSEIPAAELAETTITRIRFRKSDTIPVPPCSANPEEARIDYYFSVAEDAGGNPIWHLIEFPASSPNDVTIDVQGMGLVGSKLRWKAVAISNAQTCQPTVNDVDVGYEALKHGEYLFTSPLTLANALFRGSFETPSAAWTMTNNDRSYRGHFKMFKIYDPQTPSTTLNAQLWDAGALLQARSPDTRTIFTHQAGTKVSFATTGSSWLLNEVLPAAARTLKHNAKFVYDFDGNGSVNDDDARWLIQWTRGWETPVSQQRAWKLGALNSSTGALVHVPGYPSWMDGSEVPTNLKQSYQAFTEDTSVSQRRTMAYVGAQDGLLHAFDAGAFRWGDNASTSSITEQRGYFKWVGNSPDYGTGQEPWAYAAPSLLDRFKNNKKRDYYPETNAPAMVDGSLAATDLLVGTSWKTGIFFGFGGSHPYLSALDVTAPATPLPLWTSDWTDADFHGTTAAPTLGWLKQSSTWKWALVTSSGRSDTPSDVYLYLIDAATGLTMTGGKVKLNSGTGVKSDQAYGVYGRPVLVDVDGTGDTDRIYVADTNGRIWRYEPKQTNPQPCLIAALGQPIHTTPSILLRSDGSGNTAVGLYVGTSDRPDQNDTPSPPYYFYGLVDSAGPGLCELADEIYKFALPSDEKVWADAFIAADRIYVGAATGAKANICDEDASNPGNLYTLGLDADANGSAQQIGTPIGLEGSVVTGVMVFDQHVLVNTMGGKTVVVGGASWNNQASYSTTSTMKDTYWNEYIPQQ